MKYLHTENARPKFFGTGRKTSGWRTFHDTRVYESSCCEEEKAAETTHWLGGVLDEKKISNVSHVCRVNVLNVKIQHREWLRVRPK